MRRTREKVLVKNRKWRICGVEQPVQQTDQDLTRLLMFKKKIKQNEKKLREFQQDWQKKKKGENSCEMLRFWRQSQRGLTEVKNTHPSTFSVRLRMSPSYTSCLGRQMYRSLSKSTGVHWLSDSCRHTNADDTLAAFPLTQTCIFPFPQCTYSLGYNALPRIVDDKVDVEDFEELLHSDGAFVKFLSWNKNKQAACQWRWSQEWNSAAVVSLPSACHRRTPQNGIQRGFASWLQQQAQLAWNTTTLKKKKDSQNDN